MLVGAYIISMLLEIGGLGQTIRDIMRSQRAALRLAHPPESEPVTSQEAARSPGGSMTMRRNILGMQREREQGDQHLQDVMGDLVPEGRFRPMLGPGLIALGIIVGGLADIASSQ